MVGVSYIQGRCNVPECSQQKINLYDLSLGKTAYISSKQLLEKTDRVYIAF
ncbi:hypothetical protein VCRLGP7_740598 [Vibrio crassostreae]|nr:hypothetical protein VCRLGP7_740598 [Vibrio crassostreae]